MAADSARRSISTRRAPTAGSNSTGPDHRAGVRPRRSPSRVRPASSSAPIRLSSRGWQAGVYASNSASWTQSASPRGQGAIFSGNFKPAIPRVSTARADGCITKARSTKARRHKDTKKTKGSCLRSCDFVRGRRRVQGRRGIIPPCERDLFSESVSIALAGPGAGPPRRHRAGPPADLVPDQRGIVTWTTGGLRRRRSRSANRSEALGTAAEISRGSGPTRR